MQPHRNGTVRAASAAAAITLTALLALTGCTSVESKAIPPVSEVVLHPTGDPGNWLHDGYAGGIARTYATSNKVCAVGGSIIVEEEQGPGFTRRVVAKVMYSGDVRWMIEGAGCSEGRVFEGGVVVGRDYYGDRAWELLDLLTGETKTSIPVDGANSTARSITRADATVVFEVDGGSLVGVTESADTGKSEVTWTLPQQHRSEVTPLADGYIGILKPLDNLASIIDGRTGETIMEREVERPHWLTWASDGFIEKINESDPEYAFYDTSGAEVDRTTSGSQYSFVPNPLDGVLFTIADHLAAGTVVGVDAQGRPALMGGSWQGNFSRTHELPDLPDSIIMLQGVSVDGSLLMFREEASDRIVLIDATGAEVFGWSSPQSSSLRVESGLIVAGADNSTTVLFPVE